MGLAHSPSVAELMKKNEIIQALNASDNSIGAHFLFIFILIVIIKNYDRHKKNYQSLSHNTATKGHFMKLLPFIF